MTGWTGIAGTHDFAVPGEEQARSLARALADHGFPLVVGRRRDDGWSVVGYDDGPYPAGPLGHRTIDAVGRHAAVIAARRESNRRSSSR